MTFHTNADMVKHYAKELLSDGMEHTLNDIINYVYLQNGRKGISGDTLTYSAITSAMWKLADSDDRYLNTRRGHYQLNKYHKLTRILKKAESDVCRLLTVNLCAAETSGEELLEKQELGQKVRDYLILAIKAVEAIQKDPFTTRDGFSAIHDDGMEMFM